MKFMITLGMNFNIQKYQPLDASRQYGLSNDFLVLSRFHNGGSNTFGCHALRQNAYQALGMLSILRYNDYSKMSSCFQSPSECEPP